MVVYTAGFMTHVTCRLTAKNRDQLRNSTLGSRVLATFVKGPHCSHAVRKCGPFLHVLCSAICVSVYWANGRTNRDTVCGDIFVDPRNVVSDGVQISHRKGHFGGGIRLVSNPKWGAKLEAITTKVGCVLAMLCFPNQIYICSKHVTFKCSKW